MSVSRVQALITSTRASAASIWNKSLSVAEVQYNAIIKQNAEFVLKDPEKEALLLKQWVFTKLSKLPGILNGASQESKEVRKVWDARGDLSVRDMGVGALFCVELFAWFSVGEIIGRGGTITGYYL